MPVPAAVLVQGERIAAIVPLQADADFPTLMSHFADWNPLNCEQYTISPGLIDCNTQVSGEWDGFTSLSRAAVAGGVTFALVEESVYQLQTSEGSELFCDVGRVAIAGKKDTEMLESGAYALKAYMHPPSAYVEGVAEKLDNFMEMTKEYNVPLIIDPSYPSPRLLYMASPCRLIPLEERAKQNVFATDKFFAGAFPEEINPSDSSSSSSFSPSSRSSKSSSSSSAGSASLPPSRDKSPPAPLAVSSRHAFQLGQDLPHLQPPSLNNAARRRSCAFHTIYDDLHKRIAANQDSIENLSRIELLAYQNAGSTEFKGLRRHSMLVQKAAFPLDSPVREPEVSPLPVSIAPPLLSMEEQKPPDTKTKIKRPFALKITKAAPEPDSKERMYIYHLANHPDHWETNGVTVAYKHLKAKSIRVHFCSLSAAAAFSKIAKLKENSDLQVTTEICAYNLYFTAENVADCDTRLKAQPPIRNKTNCNLLWDLLKLEQVDLLASHHCMIDPEYKFQESGSFKKAVPGIPGIGFSLQAVWTKLRQPALVSHESLQHYLIRLSKWLSTTPAQLLGLDRGSISPGMLADLVVWDPEAEVVGICLGKSPSICPFQGEVLHGKVSLVLVRGQIAYREGTFYPVGRMQRRGL